MALQATSKTGERAPSSDQSALGNCPLPHLMEPFIFDRLQYSVSKTSTEGLGMRLSMASVGAGGRCESTGSS